MNLLLALGGTVLGGAAVLSMAAVAVERLTAVCIISPMTIGIAAALAGAILAVLWLRARPTMMHAALLIDQRLSLAERFSTTLALAGQDNPFARSAEAQTRGLVRSLSLRGQFAVRPTGRWFATAGLWLLTAAAAFWLPQFDVFGVEQRQQAQRQQAQADAVVREQIQQALASVKTAVQQLGQADLDAELAKLEGLATDGRGEEVRRDAIRKLGELDDALKKLAAERGTAEANALRQALAPLRGQGDALREMNSNLSRGQMAEAARQARDLAEQLRKGELNEEQRAKIERELAELNKRMNELADRNEQQGGDGNSADQQARQAASETLRKLAEQLGQCCGSEQAGQSGNDGQTLSPEELEQLAEMLDQLEQAQRLARLLDGADMAIEDAIAKIGLDGALDGDMCRIGCPDGEDDDAAAMAMALRGGPGPGAGHGTTKVKADYEGQAADRKVSAATAGQDDQAPPIASWLFRGEQVRGQTARDLTSTVQAAKDRAAEAVTEHRIPRKYESSVKDYFEKLQSGPRQD